MSYSPSGSQVIQPPTPEVSLESAFESLEKMSNSTATYRGTLLYRIGVSYFYLAFHRFLMLVTLSRISRFSLRCPSP